MSAAREVYNGLKSKRSPAPYTAPTPQSDDRLKAASNTMWDVAKVQIEGAMEYFTRRSSSLGSTSAYNYGNTFGDININIDGSNLTPSQLATSVKEGIANALPERPVWSARGAGGPIA